MNRFLIQNELRRCYKITLLNSRCTFRVPFFRYKSHYTSLGLESTASTKDIKSAYYKLSLKHHPDKNDGSPESVEKFRQIAEAYEVLGNPEKKKEYDRDCHTKSDYYTSNSRGHHQDARTGYYYRAARRTGRDQYYNYEEHIRKHYEQFYREREQEQENLRRYYNRYYQKNHEYYRAKPPNYPPTKTLKELLTSRAFYSLIALWGFLIIMSLFTDGDQIRKKNDKTIYYNVHKSDIPRPIYYNVNKEKDNDVKE
ncbi:hypothetical protein JTE90_004808 [Oedothorax gibbosus]|uniref:J domain-containing protein n=1 Tax=Oedothorax gibbosus TaxID=931172 RepID=A0AAV6VGP0_9ARAC|nr:hypothetical protein JTE90_004808 [Oedothorax gibbosus]